MVGGGSIRGGLEFVMGRFGLSLTTLLLTSMLASALFLFFATIGLSENICFRVLSCSIPVQRKFIICAMSLHIGLNLTGETGCFYCSLMMI